MTQEELQKLYRTLVSDDEDECGDDYHKAIRERGGEWFMSFWQDHFHESTHVEEDMIDFMKKQGFIVLDDPYCTEQALEATGWVVFPPNT